MDNLSIQDIPPFFYLVNGGSSQVVTVAHFDMSPNALHLYDYSFVTRQNNEDSCLWYAEDFGTLGFRLRNKKSGLYLGKTSGQTLSQFYTDKDVEQVGWKFSAVGDGTCRIALASGTVGNYPAGGVLSQDGAHADNPSLNNLNLRVETPDWAAWFHWKLAPVGSLDSSYTLTLHDRDKVAGGIEKSAELASDALKLTGDIVKAATGDKTGDKPAAIIYAASLVAKLVAGISGLVDYFSDEGDDPTQLLYQAMMPAIRGLVRKVDAGQVTQAAGYAAAARMEFEEIGDIVNRTMAQLNTGNPTRINDADVRRVLGNDLKSVHEAMANARQNFDRALGILASDEDGFVPWVQVAQQSIAFELLRFSIDPTGHGQEAFTHANFLKNHAMTTLQNTEQARRARLTNGVDGYLSSPNKIGIPQTAYQNHLDRTVAIALSGDAVNQLVSSCDSIVTMVGNVMPTAAVAAQ